MSTLSSFLLPHLTSSHTFALDVKWDPSCRKKKEERKLEQPFQQHKTDETITVEVPAAPPTKILSPPQEGPEHNEEKVLPEAPKYEQPEFWTHEKHEEGEREYPQTHEHERRRTRPRPSAPIHRPGERQVVPNTLREVLEGVTVQHVAMENWSRKRLVLVGSGQTLERV